MSTVHSQPAFDAAARQSAAAALAPFSYDGAKSSARWSFLGGFPDPAYFPSQELGQCLSVAAAEDPSLLQYGDSEHESLRYGEASLRKVLLDKHRADLGSTAGLANIMVTQGAVHAIELIYRAFLDPGDVVILESPTWGVAISLARQLGADVEAVPIGAKGLDADALEARINEVASSGRRLKLVYTIPTFQTPTGAVMPVATRRRLARLATEHGFMVLEDGTYAALRYDGAVVPSIQSFDHSGAVLRVGSFSKSVAPALRTGWIAGSASTLEVVAGARNDLGVSQWIARATALFVQGGQYEAHLARMLGAYRRKRDLLHRCLEAACGDLATWTVPEGGYFFWLELRDAVDGTKAKKLASAAGVKCRPGESFYGTPSDGRQFVRIAFSQVAESIIPEGIEVLGKALNASRTGPAR